MSNHLDKNWLHQKYFVEGLSTYDIAKIVNRDPKRVYEKLIDFGIPTRPRGHNLSGDDCYMKREGVVNPFLGKHHSEQTRKVLSEKANKPKPHLRGKQNGMYGRSGALNPRYIDGSSPERQRAYASSEWKEIQRQIYKRDNYCCVKCGAPKKGWRSIHAHHIKPWAGNPSLRFDKDNIVTLCSTCHRWVHSKKNTQREYIG